MKKKWLKIGVGSLILGGLLLAGAYFYLTSEAFIKGVVLPRAAVAAGLPISVDTVSFSPFGRLRTTGLKVGDDLLEAERLAVDFKPWPLLKGKVKVDDIQLDGLGLHVVQAADGTFNFPIGSGSSDNAGGEPPEIDVGKITLNDLALTYVRQERTGPALEAALQVKQFTVLGLAPERDVSVALAGLATLRRGSDLDCRAQQLALDLKATLDRQLMPSELALTATTELAGKAGEVALDSVRLALDVTAAATATGISLKTCRLVQRDGETVVGRVEVSGGVALAPLVPDLNLTVEVPDRRLLNLAAGLAGGFRVGEARLTYNGRVGGGDANQIVITGDFALTDLALSGGPLTQPLPPITITAKHDVRLSGGQRVRVQTAAAAITEGGVKRLQLRVDEPIDLVLDKQFTAPPAKLELEVDDLDLRLLQPLAAGAAIPAGRLAQQLHVTVAGGGQQIAVVGRTEIRDLQLPQAPPLAITITHPSESPLTLTDFQKVACEALAIDVSDASRSLLKAAVKVTADVSGAALLQVRAEAPAGGWPNLLPETVDGNVRQAVGGTAVTYEGAIQRQATGEVSAVGQAAAAPLQLGAITGQGELPATVQLNHRLSLATDGSLQLDAFQVELRPEQAGTVNLQLTKPVKISAGAPPSLGLEVAIKALAVHRFVANPLLPSAVLDGQYLAALAADGNVEVTGNGKVVATLALPGQSQTPVELTNDLTAVIRQDQQLELRRGRVVLTVAGQSAVTATVSAQLAAASLSGALAVGETKILPKALLPVLPAAVAEQLQLLDLASLAIDYSGQVEVGKAQQLAAAGKVSISGLAMADGSVPPLTIQLEHRASYQPGVASRFERLDLTVADQQGPLVVGGLTQAAELDAANQGRIELGLKTADPSLGRYLAPFSALLPQPLPSGELQLQLTVGVDSKTMTATVAGELALKELAANIGDNKVKGLNIETRFSAAANADQVELAQLGVSVAAAQPLAQLTLLAPTIISTAQPSAATVKARLLLPETPLATWLALIGMPLPAPVQGGKLAAEVALSGSLTAAQASATVDLSDLTLQAADQLLREVAVTVAAPTVRYDGKQVTVTDLSARARSAAAAIGGVTTSAQYQLADGTLAAEVAATAAIHDLAALAKQLGFGDYSAMLTRPLDLQVGSKLRLAGDQLRAEQTALRVSDAGRALVLVTPEPLALSLTTMALPVITCKAVLSGLDLSLLRPVLPAMMAQASGQISGQSTIVYGETTPLLRTEGSLDADLDLDGKGAAPAFTAGVKYDVRVISPTELTLARASMTAAGAQGELIALDITGTVRDALAKPGSQLALSATRLIDVDRLLTLLPPSATDVPPEPAAEASAPLYLDVDVRLAQVRARGTDLRNVTAQIKMAGDDIAVDPWSAELAGSTVGGAVAVSLPATGLPRYKGTLNSNGLQLGSVLALASPLAGGLVEGSLENLSIEFSGAGFDSASIRKSLSAGIVAKAGPLKLIKTSTQSRTAQLIGTAELLMQPFGLQWADLSFAGGSAQAQIKDGTLAIKPSRVRSADMVLETAGTISLAQGFQPNLELRLGFGGQKAERVQRRLKLESGTDGLQYRALQIQCWDPKCLSAMLAPLTLEATGLLNNADAGLVGAGLEMLQGLKKPAGEASQGQQQPRGGGLGGLLGAVVREGLKQTQPATNPEEEKPAEEKPETKATEEQGGDTKMLQQLFGK